MSEASCGCSPDEMTAALETARASLPSVPSATIGLDEETRQLWRSRMKPGPEDDFTPEQAAALDENLTMARRVGEAVESIALKQFDFAKIVGQIQAASMMRDFASVSALVLIQQMKETKAYKGMQVPDGSGGVQTITTFEDFCTLMGMSYRKVAEDLQNLAVFGEAFMESAQKMGLGYRQLRQLRALPEDDRQVLIEGEKVGNDPEALKDLLEDLAARRAEDKKKLAEAEAEATEAAGRLRAKDAVLADQNTRLMEAKEELAKMKNIPPDERAKAQAEKEQNALKELHLEGFKVLGAITAYLAKARPLLEAEYDSPSLFEAANDLTASLCRTMAHDFMDAGLSTDFRVAFYPMGLAPDFRAMDAAMSDTDSDGEAEAGDEADSEGAA